MPRVRTNEELYKRTKVTPCSLIICKIRLSWFGHLLRLPSETPAKRSLKAFVKTWKRSAGRPKPTWLSLILSDISKYSNINLSDDQEKDLESLEKICDDRQAWIKTVDCIMSSKKTKMQWWWFTIELLRKCYFAIWTCQFGVFLFLDCLTNCHMSFQIRFSFWWYITVWKGAFKHL